MKAAQLNQYGGAEAITIADIPSPEVSRGKIIVEVKAAGVNPFDWKIQNGFLKEYIPLTFPIIIGGDFAGIVTEVGDGVSDFTKGDEVFGEVNYVATGAGSFAQFVLADPATTSLKPESYNFGQAGALPLAGESAVQALTEHMKLKKGQKILIHGGAGGIGSIAIQIAKHIGAYVATTVSTNDMEYAKQLGADEVIDYKSHQFEDFVKEYDAAFDTVGGATTNRSVSVLKKGGILVSMIQKADEAIAKERGVTAIAQATHATSARLAKLRELADAGALKVNVEKTFPLDQAANALDYLKNTPPRGKVVITME